MPIKMAPKKQKISENMKDGFRRYFGKENVVPGSPFKTPRNDLQTGGKSQMNSTKVKKQMMDETSTDEHLHRFNVKFGSDPQKYTTDCEKPCTVLEVIKSKHFTNYQKEIEKPGEKKRLEENVIIKVGEGNDSYIVATHFPCSCLPPGMCLTISTSNNVIEKKQQQVRVLPREKYSVFFIDKEGGKYSKSKTDMIFRCKNIQQQFRYFCVYGTKGMRVEEALRQDGRFVDGLTDFTLSDNRTGDVTNCTEVVDNLYGNKFQICLPRKGKTKATNPSQVVQEQDSTQQTSQEEENASASPKAQNIEVTKVLENARQKGVSVKASIEELKIQIDLNEINDLLRKQFPKLKAWMESRFPGLSFEETLKLKRENFGKIQNSFSEVHTVRGLLDLSKSICLLMIEENNSGSTELKKTVQGTGFVLFDNFVLTNAHLFEPWEKINNWVNYLTITAEFSFESKGKPGMRYQATLVGGTHDLDFALLELIQLPDQLEVEEMPPGLLKIFGPVPLPVYDGGACIIGHPAGGVKKMDVTCIIRKEDREQAVEQNLEAYKDYLFTVCSINQNIKMNPYADIHVTYNSFMYHGSSGSPVFDASGRVFGLHSGGFFYDKVIPGHSVVEYAYPLLDIFKKLLGELQKTGRGDLLERIMNEATGNPYLETILESVGLKQTKVQALSVENQGRTDETGEQSDSEEEMDQS